MHFLDRFRFNPSQAAQPVRDRFDQAMRPRSLAEFTGQDHIKAALTTALRAAKARGEALDHLLLYGPPGLGKTTLAQLMAEELGVAFTGTSGPVLKTKVEASAVLAAVEEKQILFVDEIHALPSQVEEILYPVMEDFKLDLLLGKGKDVQAHTMSLPRFTLVGATTRQGQLNAPLRDRFGISFRLLPYEVPDLGLIVKRSAGLLAVDIDDDAALDIARRSRGTPRIANRLLKRVRDYAQVHGSGRVDAGLADQALNENRVDRLGLDDVDQKIMACLLKASVPLGLNVLAAACDEEPVTVADLYEPYLVQLGFVERTARGRTATAKAQDYYGRGGLFA